MILGGVEIPFPAGPVGHSDADVVLHAVMDALLGAAGLGDIGTHFPPSDDRYHGASSLGLLREVVALLALERLEVVNVDVVVVAEQPRIAPHVAEMQGRIAQCVDTSPKRISIKATTNEGVGPEGRGEAISAQAVALLEGPA